MVKSGVEKVGKWGLGRIDGGRIRDVEGWVVCGEGVGNGWEIGMAGGYKVFREFVAVGGEKSVIFP